MFYRIRYLYDSGSVENILPDRLKLLHILQDLHHPYILGVNNAESSHVDKIILEVFQIKRLNILKTIIDMTCHELFDKLILSISIIKLFTGIVILLLVACLQFYYIPK